MQGEDGMFYTVLTYERLKSDERRSWDFHSLWIAAASAAREKLPGAPARVQLLMHEG